MKKTSLYIDSGVDQALERRAVAEGVTKAELVRRVLSDAVSGRPRPRAQGVFEGPGISAQSGSSSSGDGFRRAVIVLDTSVVVTFMNRGDHDHARVAEWMEATDEELLTTPLIVAEIDHLVSRVGGV